jgi:hypothetical protein
VEFKDKTVWGWVDRKAGLPTVKEQIVALNDFGCEQIYDASINSIHEATRHGEGRHNDVMVVIGLRVLHGKHAAVMQDLDAVGSHDLFSIATNTLYDCSNAETFNRANREYNAQKIAPANKAIEGAPGPKRILTKKHIKAAQLMRDSGTISLDGISKRLLEEHKVSVSASTLSRRLEQ